MIKRRIHPVSKMGFHIYDGTFHRLEFGSVFKQESAVK